MSDHSNSQLNSPCKSASDHSWSDDAVLWIHLYHDLLYAAICTPSSPVVTTSSTIAHEFFIEFFESIPETNGTSKEVVRAKTQHEFRSKRNALVSDKVSKIFTSLVYRTKKTDCTMIRRITITPSMLDEYKKLRGTQNLYEELASPDQHVELWAFVNGALREEYPDLYPRSTSSIKACEEASEPPHSDRQVVASHEHAQTAFVQDQESLMPIVDPRMTPDLKSGPAVPGLLITFKNVELNRTATDDEAGGWHKRSPGKVMNVERMYRATDIGQPFSQESSHREPSIAARSTRQTSSTLSGTVRRKASTPSNDQPPAKRLKTAEPTTSKATAKVKIRKPWKITRINSIDSDPMEDVVHGKEFASVTAVPNMATVAAAGISRKKSSTGKSPKLISPTPKIPNEMFPDDPQDSNAVIARYRYKLFGYDEVELADKISKHRSASKDQQTEGRKVYLEPDPTSLRLDPRKAKGTWKEPAKGSSKWTREDEEWEPTVLIRTFDVETQEYLSGHTMISHFVKAFDPNNRAWRQKYNKALDQIRRRDDPNYKLKVTRFSWADEERQALYRAINKWCKVKGVDKFCLESGVLDMRQMAEDINSECLILHQKREHTRSHDMVRSQIRNAIGNGSENFKNHPIKVLAARALKLKHSIASGMKISREERFPDEAIPLENVRDDEDEHLEED
jgi:hypothetical protein